MARGPEFWDDWFLGLARYMASAAKDPSTKVGCVIKRPDRTIASVGYNGFPRNVDDRQDLLESRRDRLLRTVHAETNAIVTAREPLHGFTMYVWPFQPCATCAGLIIQAGITRVVAPEPDPALAQRWAESLAASEQMFSEAGVSLYLVRPARFV